MTKQFVARGSTMMPAWYRLTKDDSRARMFFKTVCINAFSVAEEFASCANALSSD
jgi:hypothetical protein